MQMYYQYAAVIQFTAGILPNEMEHRPHVEEDGKAVMRI
jgi:hypothetical protein